jgi:predicted phage terminase large subunit-like protein
VTLYTQMADALEHGWRSRARPEQLAPDGDWTIWLYLAGRGAGKSYAAANFVQEEVEAGRATRIALVGATAADIRDVMVEGPSGIMSVAPDYARPAYEPSKRRLTWPSGAVATCFGAEESDRLRGQNADFAYCDELCAWSNMQNTWDMLMLGLRIGVRPRCVVATTPRPSKLLKDLISREGKDVVVTRSSSYANRANLAPAFFERILRLYEGTRLGRQELNAELLDDIEGALWSRDVIEASRRKRGDMPELKRIVVAIDPAVSTSESSDETGIIVAALGADEHGYVLHDASGKFQPVDWARKAIALYRQYGADRVVAEVNQGGDMVETTLRSVDANVPFRGVHAKRGKILRAEPVSALYEQGRVHHVGCFPELEDQMATFAGGNDSPDRLDALVYAIKELMVSNGNFTGMLTYYERLCSDTTIKIPGHDHDWSLEPKANSGKMINLRAPDGVSHYYGLSGACYAASHDGVFMMTEDDSEAALKHGFVDA